ncbi:MAG: glutamate racemase [Oscillospiraceae bacterium]|nr:glutamate racemase [Oscillospiraceae bacterium]
MMKATQPVAFFDSGLGGISVLRETRITLPHENYIYYGDSANAPYGTKTPEEIRALAHGVMEKVLALGAKAVVIACNTATGEAVDSLRAQYPEVPIIGVEPAVKPAVEHFPGGRILVLATPQCVKSRRFCELQSRFGAQAEVISVPCGGLMEFVERGELDSPALDAYLREKLAPLGEADAAVLGCTHYPFLRAPLQRALGADTLILDGNAGIAAQLQRRLAELQLLNPSETAGSVTFYNSSDDPALLRRSEELLAL